MSFKRAFIVLLALVFISPIFGVFLPEVVGYHEPMDIVAEILELEEVSEKITWTPLYDYTLPGLSPEVGYIVSGLLGVAIILSIGFLLSKALR